MRNLTLISFTFVILCQEQRHFCQPRIRSKEAVLETWNAICMMLTLTRYDPRIPELFNCKLNTKHCSQYHYKVVIVSNNYIISPSCHTQSEYKLSYCFLFSSQVKSYQYDKKLSCDCFARTVFLKFFMEGGIKKTQEIFFKFPN